MKRIAFAATGKIGNGSRSRRQVPQMRHVEAMDLEVSRFQLFGQRIARAQRHNFTIDPCIAKVRQELGKNAFRSANPQGLDSMQDTHRFS